MKIKVRSRVFETNSSSTHSIQVSNKSKDIILDEIYEKIKKAYLDGDEQDYEDVTSIDTYIKDEKFVLTGLNLIDGDEIKNVYYVITDWIVKLQILAMWLDRTSWRFEDYREDIKTTSEHSWFISEVKNQLKLRGYDIDVLFKPEYGCYSDSIKIDETVVDSEFGQGKLTLDDFKKLFNKVMDKDYILTYMDEAYNPYSKPEVIVL